MTTPPLVSYFFSHIFNALITLAAKPNGKSGFNISIVLRSTTKGIPPNIACIPFSERCIINKCSILENLCSMKCGFLEIDMNGRTSNKHSLIFAITIPFLIFSTNTFAAVDADAAKALARQNNCFKCHGVDKEKDGPSFIKIAEKYKGRANAEQRLITHITTGEKAKLPDGTEEGHIAIKSKDMAEIRNLVKWILAQ